MKQISFLLFSLLLLSSCKKTVEKIQEDLVIKAMTDGEWKITNFKENSTDLTAAFATYKFKYYSNKTVDAINNGTVEKKGTWNGDASTLTIMANFTAASYPLTLINGSWHIIDNGWTFVIATQTVGSVTYSLRLDKV